MINSVFQTISNKFQPGSPECILSTEKAVNLRISLVFIKVCLENIIPCLLHGTKEGIDEQGATFQYKGSLDTTGGFRRGIVYYGSFLHPQALQIGLFTPGGKLEKGYMYRKEKTYTSHATNSGELVTINVKFSNGNFIKGIYPISGGNTAMKSPSRGGEIHNEFLQGTFHTDNTYSGAVFRGNMIQKGVFSFQETPDGVLLHQLSGIQEMSFPDGTVAIMQRPIKNDLEEGELKHADGSVQKGIFRIIEEEDGIVFEQISGTFVEGKIPEENNTSKGAK